MQDRFVRGFIAGISGMLIATIPNLLAYAQGISVSRYLDVAAVLLWGDIPKSTWESVLGWGATVAFCGILGIVFTYLLVYLGSGYLIFKGIIFGVTAWFLIHAAGALFKVPLLFKSTPQTSIVHLISAIVYGATVGYFLAWADRHLTVADRNFALPSPAYKLYDESSKGEENDKKK